MDQQFQYYVNGIGMISPQRTFDNTEFLDRPPEVFEKNSLTCFAPEFKNYINPVQLRRLSRMLRIGLASAIICTRDSGNSTTHGIITATGYGFSHSTASFLEEFLGNDEHQITPTHFIQGTYNGLAGLIALSLSCMGYNNTYVSSGFALEMAIQDAMLQLNNHSDLNFLVGSYDEADPIVYQLNGRAGHYKTMPTNNLQLFESKTAGTLQGEGSAFFSLSGKQTSTSWCSISTPLMVYKPTGEQELSEALNNYLEAQQTSRDKIDVFIHGASGDIQLDGVLEDLIERDFKKITELRFKHLTGEYCTASSFAIWLGASILKKQRVPAAVRYNDVKPPDDVQKILVGNHYRGRNYSFLLMERLH